MPYLEEALTEVEQIGLKTRKPVDFSRSPSVTLGDNVSSKTVSKTIGMVGMAADYICDGTADQVQFQAAIDAVSAAGGGDVLVRFSPTRYNVSAPFNPKSNVRLIGEYNAAIEKTGTGYIIQGETESFHNFTVENLTFYGKVNQEVSVPTTARTTGGAGTTTAIRISGGLDPTIDDGVVIKNVTIRKCRFRNIASLPIRIFGVDGNVFTWGCEFYNCKDPGWGFNNEVILSSSHSYMSSDNGFSASRGNRKVTIVNCTAELSAFAGIWLSGFFGDLGPTELTCVGNMVRNVGESCIALRDAPMYGTISGNTLNQGHNRGPVGVPNDDDCCGIFIAGYPYGITSAPEVLATGLTVANNLILNPARAGIYYNGVKGLHLADNKIINCGTQYLADGTTVILSTNEEQNIGIFCDVGTTVSDVTITDNQVHDYRVTPLTNWAVHPITLSGATINHNTHSGMRNQTNKATLADDVGTNVNPSYTLSGLDQHIGFSYVMKGNGRFTVRSAAGASQISNLNLHNTGTGAGAGVGQVFSAGVETAFVGGAMATRLDAASNSRYVFRVLSAGALTAADSTGAFFLEGSASGPSLGLIAGQKVKRTAVNDADYTVLLSDYLIAHTALTASRTNTLPAAATAGNGRVYIFKDEAGAAATHNVVVDANGNETIDGSATASITTNRGSLRLYCDGTAWHSF